MKQTKIAQNVAELNKMLPAHADGEIWTVRIAPKVLVEIAQKEVFRGQRNHEKDAPKKKFLHSKLFGDQRITSAARYKEGRKFHMPLIDGYNRQEVMNILNFANAPEYFTLIVHDVADSEAVKPLYKQIDNTASAKKGKALLQEAIRLAFGNPNIFQSDLLAEGSVVSGLKEINKDLYAAVESHKKGLLLIDSLYLTRQTPRMSSSVLGAIVAIAQVAQENSNLMSSALEFIRSILYTEFTPLNVPARMASESVIQDIRANYDNRKLKGILSGKHAKQFFSELLVSFAEYHAARQEEQGLAVSVKFNEQTPVQELIRNLKLAA